MDTVYKDTDGKFSKELQEDGVVLTPVQMSAITKVAIVYLGVLYDSTTYPTAFDRVTKAALGIIVFKLGDIGPLPEGRDKKAELIIYAPDYPDGIVWGQLDIKVIDLGI